MTDSGDPVTGSGFFVGAADSSTEKTPSPPKLDYILLQCFVDFNLYFNGFS